MQGEVLRVAYALARGMLTATLWHSFCPYYTDTFYAYYTDQKNETWTHNNMSWHSTAKIWPQG